MGCCSSCESGLYGCESDLPGLSGLYGLDGLTGLMGELLAPGSRIRVGFNFTMANTDYGLAAEEQGFQNVRSALRQHLQELGIFSSVNVTVTPPQYLNIVDGYILVEGTVSDGQDNPRNIGDAAQYKLSSDYRLGIIITTRDPEMIDYVPPEAQGKPGVAQVTQQPQQRDSSPPAQPGDCVWSQMSFGDYVACQLGIKSPLGGVTAGAAGALVGVGVITLLAVVLLKR